MPRYRSTEHPKRKQNLLPLWLALAGVGLFALAIFALSNRSQPTVATEVVGAPALKVDQVSIDHGDVKLDVPIRDTIRVANVGDQPLRFTQDPYIQVAEGC